MAEPSASFQEFEGWVRQIEKDVPVGILADIGSVRLREADERDCYSLTLWLDAWLDRSEIERLSSF